MVGFSCLAVYIGTLILGKVVELYWPNHSLRRWQVKLLGCTRMFLHCMKARGLQLLSCSVHHVPFKQFLFEWGILTQVLMFAQQALLSKEHLPSLRKVTWSVSGVLSPQNSRLS